LDGDPGTPPSASEADRLQSLLDSKEVREALAMADRARRIQAREAAMAEAAAMREAAERARLQAQADRSPGSGDASPGDEVAAEEEPTDPSGPSEGGSVSGRAELAEAEPLRGLDAKQRAAIYKLPPRVRDPLLEGMRQRGPAAYQSVIDTYFRQLGRDIPE
jgi:multidrug efflux pump subunit AcrA (membrane-fusion protein)